jgi:quinol monooxygenase YgiN
MAQISEAQEGMTLINVFTVDPARCDELVQILTSATDDTMRHFDGFVSASIHRSDDGHRVVNYAQWESREAWDAMRNDPRAGPHMGRAAELAESFDPIVCRVVSTRP